MQTRPHIHLRTGDPKDLDAFYRISLATGDLGRDASALHNFPKLIGHIYSAPYLKFAPQLTCVVEHNGDVLGYCAGVADTTDFATVLEENWWPNLRKTYPRPDPTNRATWTADDHRIEAIHAPEHTPASVTTRFPAHLHMNLMPILQGHAIGADLLDAWFRQARDHDIAAVHIGANARNARAVRFWAKQGFQPIETPDAKQSRTAWMGRDI